MTPLAMTGGGEAERSAGAGKGRGEEEEVVVSWNCVGRQRGEGPSKKSMNLSMIKLQEALRREKTAARTR